VAELTTVIEKHIEHKDENPRPFVWTKRVDEILDKVRHRKAASVTQHSHRIAPSLGDVVYSGRHMFATAG
jgi:hypothetical protein